VRINHLAIKQGATQFMEPQSITVTVLDIIRRSLFELKQLFGDWTLSPSSGGTYTSCPETRDWLHLLDQTE
jgi:hypothetical protein